jgi:hypothetical protein
MASHASSWVPSVSMHFLAPSTSSSPWRGIDTSRDHRQASLAHQHQFCLQGMWEGRWCTPRRTRILGSEGFWTLKGVHVAPTLCLFGPLTIIRRYVPCILLTHQHVGEALSRGVPLPSDTLMWNVPVAFPQEMPNTIRLLGLVGILIISPNLKFLLVLVIICIKSLVNIILHSNSHALSNGSGEKL